MPRGGMRNLGEMVLGVFNGNTGDRYRGVGSLLVACLLMLSACNGCAFRQPLGLSCESTSQGQVVSRGTSAGSSSAGESRGVRRSQLVCTFIYDETDLESALKKD